MIRLEPYGFRNNRETIENWKEDLPQALYAPSEGIQSRMIRRNDIPCGVFIHEYKDDTVFLSIWFVKGADERKKLLAVVCEHMVRRYHPAFIVIKEAFDDLNDVYLANSFVREGDVYLKTVEPWRKILSDRVFDEEGFIINQGQMKDIPFGWFDSKAKGCGWISAWNLLKMTGHETSMERCAKELEKGAFLGEMMGENLFRLYRWLKKQGLNLTMSLPANFHAASLIRTSPGGIILYSHKRGAHYVTYRNLGGGKVQIYNAVYGRRNHVIGIDEFLKEFTLFPTSVVIALKP